MTATNHVVMGALVATFVHNPVLALPLAFASHFALDSLPHFDYPADDGHSLKFFSWLAIDAGLAAGILYSLYLLQPANVYLILLCGVVAASPDLMWTYYISYKKRAGSQNWPWLVKFHSRIQKHTSPKLWPVELGWLLLTGGLLASRLY
jgi:hypothetical protein